MGFFEKSLGEGIVGIRQAGFEVPQSFQIPGFFADLDEIVCRVIYPSCCGHQRDKGFQGAASETGEQAKSCGIVRG